MDDTPELARCLVEQIGQPPPEGEEDRPVRLWEWLLLVGPPLVTWLAASGLYLLAFFGLGCIGILFYFLAPLICAIWAFRICRRLAESLEGDSGPTVLVVFLFVLELFLILAAFLFLTPHWD
jgi:hypothetical protein